MHKTIATLAALAIAVTALAGCTSQSVKTAAQRTGAAAAAPTSTWSPLPQRDRCDPNQGQRAGGDGVSTSGVLQPQTFADTRDLGPRPGARGTVTLHPDGHLASYIVAPHDDQTAIAARFCMTVVELTALNEVRRQNPFEPTPVIIYRGDTLNLDPCTVRTVGDETGKVYDNNLPVYVPVC